MIRQLPNFLSLVRLAGTPPLLIAAMAAGSRSWFFGLLCFAWLTDALDGFLARRLHAESERGRMLDSWADYVTAALCIAGLCWLWPEVVRREWPWFTLGAAGFFAIVLYGLLRCGRPPGYHTWLAKALAVALPFALAALLAGWSALPFHCVMVLQVLGAAEELAISLLLPGFSGKMPSAWHAWRHRGSAKPDQFSRNCGSELARDSERARSRASSLPQAIHLPPQTVHSPPAPNCIVTAKAGRASTSKERNRQFLSP